MNSVQAAKKAVKEHNLKLFSKTIEWLRFKLDASYDDCALFYQEHTGIDKDEFESLCYEADGFEDKE